MGDFVLAFTQGPEGARLIGLAHYDKPPGAPSGRRTRTYLRAGAELRWSPAVDLWGPQRFRVLVDGTEVGQTTQSQFTVPVALADGRHRWQVVAVDARGQEAAMPARTFVLDTRAPSLRVSVRGARVAGQPLRVTATARDRGQGSGIERIGVAAGDGSREVRARGPVTVSYRRAGRYTLTVRALDRAGNVTLRRVRVTIRG
jgi:hypothetical protein